MLIRKHVNQKAATLITVANHKNSIKGHYPNNNQKPLSLSWNHKKIRDVIWIFFNDLRLYLTDVAMTHCTSFHVRDRNPHPTLL